MIDESPILLTLNDDSAENEKFETEYSSDELEELMRDPEIAALANELRRKRLRSEQGLMATDA
jgi:hypothetical protein